MSIIRKTILLSLFVLLGCAENKVSNPSFCMMSKDIMNPCIQAGSDEEYSDKRLDRMKMEFELALEKGFDLSQIESILNGKAKMGRCVEIVNPHRKYDNRDSKCTLITLYTGKPTKVHENTVVALDSGNGGFSAYIFGIDNGSSILISKSRSVY